RQQLEPATRLGLAQRRRGRRARKLAADTRAPHQTAALTSRPAPDPLLAALVDLLLPERHRRLESVDRLLAGGESGLPVWRRDGDQDAGLADLDPSDAVVDRNRT